MTPSQCFMGFMLLITLDIARSCSFPQFFQTDGTTPPRDWRTRIRDRFTKFQARIVIDGDQMRHLSNEDITFSRMCLEHVEGDKFLVSHKEKGQRRIVYTCLQLIRRSDIVWQMKTGSPADRPDLGLCSGTTWQLEGWLVVDRNRIAQTSHHHSETDRPRCVLSGGYSARFSSPVDTEHSTPGCHPYNGFGGSSADFNEVRLESRCLQGADDLYVYFRHQECLPSDLQVNGSTINPPPQRLVCLVDWQEGQYSFVLLRHDRMPYLWLLRLPTRFLSLDDSFNAYIFTDLFAATANKVIDLSVGHLHLGVVREPPRPVTSICVDEHESCVTRRGSCPTTAADDTTTTTGSEWAFSCARSCNMCNATRPFVCHFPVDWIGVWVDSGDGLKVTFNQTAVTVGGDSFHCIEWRPGFSPTGGGAGTHIKASSDVMLVAAYRNGCRLRYLCIRVLKKSSSILYIRFSRALLWPLNVTSADMIDCRLFSFVPDVASSPSGSLPTKYFRLLYSDQTRQPVHCNLPVALFNLTLESSDGRGCSRAAKMVESIGGTTIHLVTEGCSSVDHVPKAYECVLSFRAPTSNDLTIFVRSAAASSMVFAPTKNQQSFGPPPMFSGALYCWVFPEDRPDQFFLYDGSNCNESARRDIVEKNKHFALIAFSRTGVFDVDGRTTPATGSRAVLRRYQPNSSSSSAAGNATNDTRWKNTATENIDYPLGSSNPFIIFMAVVVFAIFYIPFICSVSV